MPEYALLGKRLPKPDAINRVTGRMVYADDMALPGVLAGKILGSPVAHGRIRRLDTSKAERLPGVYAVVTARDAPSNFYGGIIRDKLIFARDVVRYHGDPIAAVAADTVDTAEEATGRLREGGVALVLINRVFDFDSYSGLRYIEELRADDRFRAIPVMLVSNFDDAQSEAVQLGAAPGFGKASLGQPAMLERLLDGTC